MKPLRAWKSRVALVLSAGLATAQADPVSQIKSYAGVNPAPLAELSGGTIRSERIAVEGEALDMSVESCFVVDLPPDQAWQRLQDFSKKPGNSVADAFTVSFSNPITTPAEESDFKEVAAPSDASQLNLGAAERKNLAAAQQQGNTAPVWRQILRQRSLDFQNHGLVGSAPYSAGDKEISAAAELVHLLKKRPAILQHFVPVLDGVMTAKTADGHPLLCHWEGSKILSSATVTLEALLAARSDGALQVADITFYSSSEYYVSLILYEIHPLDVDGRKKSLVWRGDYVVTPSLASVRGLERMAAENIMLLEVKKDIADYAARCRAPAR